jgi:hypothetical protein
VATATGAIAQIELKLDGVTLATASTSPLQVPLATAAVLDGVVRAETVVTDSLGRRVTCTSNLLVDNLDIVKVNPRHIDIRPRPTRRRDEVIVRFEGVNVALLMPVEAHQIELRVPGASPVPLAPGWSGDAGGRWARDRHPADPRDPSALTRRGGGGSPGWSGWRGWHARP